MIRVVISDFGGVLTNPLQDAFIEFERVSGIPLAVLGEAMAAANRANGANPLAQLETGAVSEAEFVAIMDSHLGDLHAPGTTIANFSQVYFESLHANEPFIDCLREVKASGLRLALLTNNVREWEQRWRSFLPIDELFETVVDSGFAGVRKPDRRIYEIMLQRLRSLDGLGDVEPGECVLVDDLPPNCEAALEFGFQAVRFENTEQAVGELLGLLAKPRGSR